MKLKETQKNCHCPNKSYTTSWWKAGPASSTLRKGLIINQIPATLKVDEDALESDTIHY